eukprot:Unigene2582_Nuclearia_a/m.7973 Unigene2582_Nuclearia_a/g.7973  ORF Unigene2582_Nuclearia_a/g.7973 Unigene2582_Nuclearia_a/m.7973 type:complete len:227 (+) Unigene2582_Nuclearia_a:129-809(+)
MFGDWSGSNNMEKHLFNLRFTAKQLQRLSKNCQKEEKLERAKLKKALQQNNTEGARIYAQNAIRKKNEAINYLRLSSRVDAVASKVQTAVTMKQMTKNISGVVSQMDRAMQSMNLEQVPPCRCCRRALVLTRHPRHPRKITMTMEKFEKQFEDLDVQTQTMENAMSSTTTMTTPAEEVDQLIAQVADEAGLDFDKQVANAPFGTTSKAEQEQDDLTQRLARLRNET